MTEADKIFEMFPEFIRRYIYNNEWDSLRDIQIAAARTLLFTKNNLLLTSSTASGKTEAALFPILTNIYERPSSSVSVLYVAPLKSLINDQFFRLEDLLRECEINVTHWHGDVSQSQKKKLLQSPSGILQITPESLESLLINRSNDIIKLFGDLRYIILDEIHILAGTDRGNQILCQISRIEKKIGYAPIRVGLSATIGDTQKVAAWLSAGTNVPTDIPEVGNTKTKWRLGMEHFFIQDLRFDQTSNRAVSEKGDVAIFDAGYEYVYDSINAKKSLIFSNSREETEYVCATLRQIAAKKGDDDVFLIHHGNLSASLREEAERKMKDDDVFAVTCATVTMELGIDIGRLERVIQIDAPNSVSGFLQRMGRSGRRGQPSEMMMVFREEDPLPNAPLPDLIPWGLIRAIAIVQLYIEEKFIEPPRNKTKPFSLLFHQTLSVLASNGEMTAKNLAQNLLSTAPFSDVTPEEYKALLVSMLNNDFLEMAEEGGVIVGLAGEKLLSSFKFYAVFNDSEDFTVRCDSEEIGTITNPLPVGDRFALAGRVWEVLEVDMTRRLIYVKGVEGKMEISWPGDFGEIHTRILERMKRVLIEDTEYPYLKDNARVRLERARRTALNTGITEKSFIHLGGYTWCLFPWLGTRSFRTLRKMLAGVSAEFGISGIDFEGCYFIKFRMEKGTPAELLRRMKERYDNESFGALDLVSPKELPSFDKYDRFIPAELLRCAYAADRLDCGEAIMRINQMRNEKNNNF